MNNIGTNYVATPFLNTGVRDYRHAARIFTDGNFRLAPKYGFLFYVEFDFNPLVSGLIPSNSNPMTAQELGMVVKSVGLPKFSIETKIHNAYNRKNIVQNKINYDPISITFHDDQSDVVRDFWYDYYSFYYRDPDYPDVMYNASHKYQARSTFDWGYTPRHTLTDGYPTYNGNQPYQYIQAIRIYSLFQKQFSEYELINPIITSFKHGEHSNTSDSGLMTHEMTVQFETVKYYTGYVTQNNVGGFIDLHYDNTPSPLSPPGGSNVVNDLKGGTTTATEKITDLATLNPGAVTMSAFLAPPSVINGSESLGTALAVAARNSGRAGGNSGGFSIPNLGTLTAGITSAAVTQQQINATTASLASTTVSKVTGTIVGGISKGLGPNGGALVSLLTTAATNPKLVLNTVENIAVSYVTNAASNAVNSFVDKQVAGIGSVVSTWVNTNVTQPFTDNIIDPAVGWAQTNILYPNAIANPFGGAADSFG